MEPNIGDLSNVQNVSTIKPVMERASFGDRFFATFVDNIMLNIPLKILSLFFLAPMKDTSNPLKALVAVIVLDLIVLIANLCYFAGFAYSRNGQTLGKKWNKIKVVDRDGSDLALGRYLLREFVARGVPVVGTLLFGDYSTLWVLTYLLALSSERLALHDKIVGTQVIKIR